MRFLGTTSAPPQSWTSDRLHLAGPFPGPSRQVKARRHGPAVARYWMPVVPVASKIFARDCTGGRGAGTQILSLASRYRPLPPWRTKRDTTVPQRQGGSLASLPIPVTSTRSPAGKILPSHRCTLIPVVENEDRIASNTMMVRHHYQITIIHERREVPSARPA